MSLFKTKKGKGSSYESLNPSERNLEINGAVALESNNFFEAMQLLTQGKNNYPKNPYFDFLLGYSRENLKDFDNAISDYQNYLLKVPGHYNAYFRIGLCYQNSNRFEQSLRNYNLAESNFAEFLTIADSESLLGNSSQRIDSYFNIPAEKIYSNRGLVKINLGDSQGGIQDCTRAISINHRYSNPYFIRGIEYHKIGQMDLAKKDILDAERFGYPMARQILDQYF